MQPMRLCLFSCKQFEGTSETHSGEKPNKCNQCEYVSSKTSHLKTHIKIHTGEKSNKCNQCDYASSQVGHLRRHLKTHTEEKATNVETENQGKEEERNIFIQNWKIRTFQLLTELALKLNYSLLNTFSTLRYSLYLANGVWISKSCFLNSVEYFTFI